MTDDERLTLVQDEYRKAAETWGRQRARLNAAIDRARMERAQAEDAETAATGRAEAAEAKVAAVEALADEWERIPDFAKTQYDQGRVDQRHMAATELYEALGVDTQAKEVGEPWYAKHLPADDAEAEARRRARDHV